MNRIVHSMGGRSALRARVRAVLAARAEKRVRVRPQSWRTARAENGCGSALSLGGQPAEKMMALALLCITLFTGVARSQATAAAPQTDLPTVTYRRVFQGSTPEFVEIAVRQDGAARADVRQLSETASPQEFQVGTEMRGKIFDLARAMHNFQRADLDAHRRVAYLGEKTLRWEKGAEAYETKYNYTVDAKANQLQRIFENLAQEQADLATLEQQLRYDRLGINDALRQFEGHLRQHVLPEPARFLPVLDRIAEDSRLLEMARQRARSLAAQIRVAQGR
jgi:hypothetical protein